MRRSPSQSQFCVAGASRRRTAIIVTLLQLAIAVCPAFGQTASKQQNKASTQTSTQAPRQVPTEAATQERSGAADWFSRFLPDRSSLRLGPYYTVQLPRKGYFDKNQEQLSKMLGPDVGQYIFFIEPKDFEKSGLPTKGSHTKPWTASEKDDIRQIFSRLYEIAPGLIVRAAS